MREQTRVVFNRVVFKLQASLAELTEEQRGALLRCLKREVMEEQRLIDPPHPRLAPDTRGCVRVSSRTRAGRDGRLVFCPHCGAGRRWFHFNHDGGRCEDCGLDIPKREWWTAAK